MYQQRKGPFLLDSNKTYQLVDQKWVETWRGQRDILTILPVNTVNGQENLWFQSSLMKKMKLGNQKNLSDPINLP